MKRILKLFRIALPALLLCLFCSSAPAEGLFVLTKDAAPGDGTVRLTLLRNLTGLSANVFSADVSLAVQADGQDDQLTLTLARPLREGESLRILLQGKDEGGNILSDEMTVTVPSLRQSKLSALRERVGSMWETWLSVSAWTEQHHQVCLPNTWGEIPFITWADEAPEVEVLEDNGEALIRVFDQDLTGWQVQTGSGAPVVYTDCEYLADSGMFRAAAPFDSVCLARPMEPDQIGISISYERDAGFLPSHPVLEWSEEKDGHTRALACYAWGNTRSFDGGMYAVIMDDLQIYGEYDGRKILSYWYDLANDLSFSAAGELLSGELPEGYAIPVTR